MTVSESYSYWYLNITAAPAVHWEMAFGDWWLKQLSSKCGRAPVANDFQFVSILACVELDFRR